MATTRVRAVATGVAVFRVECGNPTSWTKKQLQDAIGFLIGLGRDPTVEAIALTGPSLFTNSPDHKAEQADVAGLLAVIADCALPVVALIPGHAQGPGLELALACHHRIATRTAQLSFPQLTSGLLPANGGVERLVRLVGVSRAAELAVFGRVASGATALAMGLLDAIVEDDPEAAVLPLTRLHPRVERPLDANWPRLLAAAREEARQRRPGQDAPVAAVQAMEHGLRWPLPRAIAETRKLAEVLAKSEQAAALRHAAEGEARVLATSGLAPAAAGVTEAEIAARLRDEAGDVAYHVFAPGLRVRLVEIVPAAETLPATLAGLAELMRRLGKPVLFRAPGLVGGLVNRLRWPMLREAIHLLDEGATPARVDRALLAFGFAFAPLAALDLEGLRGLTESCLAGADAWDRYSPTIDLMFDAGRLGAATGRGWYRYEGGQPIMDRTMETLLIESAQAQRLSRRDIDEAEIVRRCLEAGVAGARASLASGDAANEAEIDAVWTGVLGFPRWRGGLLYHARLAPAEWRPEISPRTAAPLLPPPPAGQARPDARRPVA